MLTEKERNFPSARLQTGKYLETVIVMLLSTPSTTETVLVNMSKLCKNVFRGLFSARFRPLFPGQTGQAVPSVWSSPENNSGWKQVRFGEEETG